MLLIFMCFFLGCFVAQAGLAYYFKTDLVGVVDIIGLFKFVAFQLPFAVIGALIAKIINLSEELGLEEKKHKEFSDLILGSVPREVINRNIRQLLGEQAEVCQRAQDILIKLQTKGLVGIGKNPTNCDFDIVRKDLENDFRFHQDEFYDLHDLTSKYRYNFVHQETLGERDFKFHSKRFREEQAIEEKVLS